MSDKGAENDAQSMAGKTVVVTGANSGVGLETTRALAGRGARVIMACRNVDLGQKALDDIKTSHPNAAIVLHKLDLASLKSIHDFAQLLQQTEQRLDVLINNAGLFNNDDRRETTDGFELHMGTNYFGPFALSLMLIELLKKTPHSRVIYVGSDAHKYFTAFSLDDLNFNNFPGSRKAYGSSKVAVCLLNIEFHRRCLKPFGIASLALHPGSIQSNFINGFPWYMSLIVKIAGLFGGMITPAQGALTSIHLATIPTAEAEAGSGKYFDKCRVSSESAEARNPESAQRLWALSEQMVNEKLSGLGLPPLPHIAEP